MLSEFVYAASRGVSPSTAQNYRTAVRSFIRFNGGRDVPLSSLNADAVRCYERWLHGRAFSAPLISGELLRRGYAMLCYAMLCVPNVTF